MKLRIETLVQSYYANLYKFAYRLSGSPVDAEDLCQETFCSAQKKLGQLRDDGKILNWLYTILRNAYLHRLRADKRYSELTPEACEYLAAPSPEELPAISSAQLQEALNLLPEAYRTPLILFYFQDMAYKEISEQLDVPIGTVMSRISRGKEYLKRYFHKEIAEETFQETPGKPILSLTTRTQNPSKPAADGMPSPTREKIHAVS